jgi:hypothetical protein
MVRVAPLPGPSGVLFQAPNSIGLGHISRLAAIALAMKGLLPDLPFAFLIEGVDHGLLASLGLPWLSLPKVAQVVEGPEWSVWPIDHRDRFLRSNAESVKWTPVLGPVD